MGNASDDEESNPISEERLDALEARIDELASEVQAERRGAFGLPKPPTPGDLLRFADEHALPTAIAALEANVRALEMLNVLTGSLRGQARDGSSADRGGVAHRVVAELDRAREDLREAIETGGLPENDQARAVLAELRAVRDEIEASLEPREDGDEGTADTASPTDQDPTSTLGHGPDHAEVKAELENIKRSLREDGAADGAAEQQSVPDDTDGAMGDEPSDEET